MTFEHDIFVSYARNDRDLVQPFITYLREELARYIGREPNLWLDANSISPGESWPEALRSALTLSRIMLTFISPSYLNSNFAMHEYATFSALKRPIFPVVLAQYHPDEVQVRALLGDQLGFWAPQLKIHDQKYLTFVQNLAGTIKDVLADSEDRVAPQPPVPSKEPSTPAKGYVFLSYAEEDSDFLAELRAFFGEHGYAYWEYEQSDRDYQKRIDLELESAISNAVATVSVLSESWKSSDWSVRELYFSQEIGKPVFLLKAKPFGPILAISGLPYIDFTKSSEQAFSRLARELKHAGL